MRGLVCWSLRRATLLACLVSLAMGGAAHARSEPVVLERTGKWDVGFDPESCNVQTEFGRGRDKIVLQLYFYGPGPAFELRAIGAPFHTVSPRVRFTTDFGPIVNPTVSAASIGRVSGLPLAIVYPVWLNDPPSDAVDTGRSEGMTPEQERAVTWLDVRFDVDQTWRLQTGPMDKLMQVIRFCQEGMIRSWGYDLNALREFKSQVTPVDSPNSWVTSRDFRDAWAMAGLNAIVQYRLDVSEDGQVEACHLQKPMNPPQFSLMVCENLKRRARFHPAVDKDGRPARSFFVGRLGFQSLAPGDVFIKPKPAGKPANDH